MAGTQPDSATVASAHQVSFRVFAAGLEYAEGEALRVFLGILHKDVDQLIPHERLVKALKALTGKE